MQSRNANATSERLGPDAAGVARAAALLTSGGLVAFPTETVYGLGADACNADAVAGIFAAKGRPSFNPLIVHVATVEAARALIDLDNRGDLLAQAFWPGALTLVGRLKPGAGIASLVTAGLDTLAVRVPDHPLAQRLLAAFGRPVAAPSANPSGRVSPTTAAHVLAGLDGRIDAVLDGGACGVGLESTIISVVGAPALLRAGGVPAEALEQALGVALRHPGDDPSAPISPGQLASHYAPRGRVRLNATTAQNDEVLLGFGPVSGTLTLSAAGDLQEAAARLFDCLHRLDAMDAPAIAVAPVPDRGLGRAINDRLRRAAAPR
ncbi:L-threonylcarbamoyladenylate synthase [Loktanella sp. SALINAS62]|uniref:L-threonylcarbamoyladenylate synthase n=1 Tax=Loktanella sp. SALINAS62 TaxID=2706124 RepID=UPI001B8B8FC8|nr:L-threonylcarbamoyladenylate synthase [Loktanella sp. SALINAS62]MBS1301025.1 threonylcarbamoyl-AMP synthase [Loktanella sp. SALINAS62]